MAVGPGGMCLVPGRLELLQHHLRRGRSEPRGVRAPGVEEIGLDASRGSSVVSWRVWWFLWPLSSLGPRFLSENFMEVCQDGQDRQDQLCERTGRGVGLTICPVSACVHCMRSIGC